MPRRRESRRPSRRHRPPGLAAEVLELRRVPALFLLGQSWNTMTDNFGNSYPVNDGGQLIAALQQVQRNGSMLGTLDIKGHGGDGTIFLTNDNTPAGDALLWTNGRLYVQTNMNLVDVTDLVKETTCPNSQVILEGCFTGGLGRDLSTITNDGLVTSSPYYPALGIPGTGLTVGAYTTFQDGEEYVPPAAKDPDAFWIGLGG
jgi:hypothetical protein